MLVHCAVKTDYCIYFHAGLEKYIFLLLSIMGSLMNYNCLYSIVFLCFNVLYSLCWCCYILPVVLIHLTFKLYAPPLCINMLHIALSAKCLHSSVINKIKDDSD